MPVDVQRKGRCGVSQIALYGLDVVSALNGGNSVAMPLRYIYDNTKKSSNCNSFTVFGPPF